MCINKKRLTSYFQNDDIPNLLTPFLQSVEKVYQTKTINIRINVLMELLKCTTIIAYFQLAYILLYLSEKYLSLLSMYDLTEYLFDSETQYNIQYPEIKIFVVIAAILIKVQLRNNIEMVSFNESLLMKRRPDNGNFKVIQKMLLLLSLIFDVIQLMTLDKYYVEVCFQHLVTYDALLRMLINFNQFLRRIILTISVIILVLCCNAELDFGQIYKSMTGIYICIWGPFMKIVNFYELIQLKLYFDYDSKNKECQEVTKAFNSIYTPTFIIDETDINQILMTNIAANNLIMKLEETSNNDGSAITDFFNNPKDIGIQKDRDISKDLNNSTCYTKTFCCINSQQRIFSDTQSYEKICESVSRIKSSQNPDEVISIRSVRMTGSLKKDCNSQTSAIVDVYIKQVYWKRKGAIILQVFESNKLYHDFLDKIYTYNENIVSTLSTEIEEIQKFLVNNLDSSKIQYLMPYLSYFKVVTDQNWIVSNNLDILKVLSKLHEDSYFSIVEVTASQVIRKVEIIIKQLRTIMECQKHEVKVESEGLTENLRFRIDTEYLMMLIQNILHIFFISSKNNKFHIKLSSKENEFNSKALILTISCNSQGEMNKQNIEEIFKRNDIYHSDTNYSRMLSYHADEETKTVLDIAQFIINILFEKLNVDKKFYEFDSSVQDSTINLSRMQMKITIPIKVVGA